MTELANSLGVTQRPLTDLVDALGADKLVECRPNLRDKRSTVVSLTNAGTVQPELTWRQYRRDIGMVFGDLSAEHQKQLLDITPILTDAIRQRLHPARERASLGRRRHCRPR